MLPGLRSVLSVDVSAEQLPVRIYTTAQGLSRGATDAVAHDPAGKLRVGIFTRGVTEIARNGFISYNQDDGRGQTRALSTPETQSGEL